MLGGYGCGMGGMYGGGMGGMGGMYGSGLGGMYGSSMGGMYGSGMGGMYGSGLGMSSGLMGSGNQFSSGIGNRGYSSTGFNSIGDLTQGNQNGVGGVLNQNGAGGPLSLPASGDGELAPPGVSGNGSSPVRSGISVCDAPPPLHETPEEKVKRLREQRRHEKESLRQKKERREQLRRQARVEVAGHVTNVLAQTLRTVLEVCTVCFGSYYSIKAFKQMGQMAPMTQNAMGAMVPVAGGTNVVSRTVTESTKSGKGWRFWIITSLFFFLAEVLYRRLAQKREMNTVTQQQFITDELLDSENDSDENELLTPNLKDAWSSRAISEKGRHPGTFVALHDYESPNGEGFLNFKAGDTFLVDDFSENTWCIARRVDENGLESSSSLIGYVPSNFLRSIEQLTKL